MNPWVTLAWIVCGVLALVVLTLGAVILTLMWQGLVGMIRGHQRRSRSQQRTEVFRGDARS